MCELTNASDAIESRLQACHGLGQAELDREGPHERLKYSELPFWVFGQGTQSRYISVARDKTVS